MASAVASSTLSPPSLSARLQASAFFRHSVPPILCLVRLVFGLKALSCLRCTAWQPEVYPVPGAGKQVVVPPSQESVDNGPSLFDYGLDDPYNDLINNFDLYLEYSKGY